MRFFPDTALDGCYAGGSVFRQKQAYEFYQYWRNVGDQDVLKCLRMLTFLPLEQIDEMDKWEGSQLNTAKEILAFELTKLVHGEEEAKKAQDAAKALFVGGGDMSNVPTTTLTAENLTDGSIGILDMMVTCKLAPSKKEARRLVEQGGVTVNDEKVSDVNTRYTADDLSGDGIMVRKGKKVYHRVQM